MTNAEAIDLALEVKDVFGCNDVQVVNSDEGCPVVRMKLCGVDVDFKNFSDLDEVFDA